MNKDFYRAFEDEFRGSRDLIKNRLEKYKPFFIGLKDTYPEPSALDLGCGRGEWLELLNEHGFNTKGIDLDEGMLADCYSRGLNVEKGNFLEHLPSIPSNSISLLSAFHVVEHINFEDLDFLIKQSLRILMPGGLLILETPNPENLVVASCNFYLDPTHNKPIPAKLLEFLVKYNNFYRVKKVGLHENNSLTDFGSDVLLIDVLDGTSRDYAVIAQKQGSDCETKKLNKAFELNLGCDIVDATKKFDLTQDKKISQINNELIALKSDLSVSKADIAVLLDNYDRTSKELISVYKSNSWKITAPLRWISLQIKLIREEGVKLRFKKFIKKIIRKLHGLLREKPYVKEKIKKIIAFFGLIGFSKKLLNKSMIHHEIDYDEFNENDMSLVARYIYTELNKNQKKKEN